MSCSLGHTPFFVLQLEEKLNYYIQNPYFIGVRHIVEAEEDDWLLNDHVQRGLGMFSSFYDSEFLFYFLKSLFGSNNISYHVRE